MFLSLKHPDQYCHVRCGGVPSLAGEVFVRDEAQMYAVWLDRDERMRARCSLWWSHTPMLGDLRIGAIGHYAADGIDSGARLLDAACIELKRKGCAQVIGPMDGNTWRGYRLIIQRYEAPAFFLEPDHPDDWPAHFIRAGFGKLASYCSSICEDLAICDPRAEPVEGRLAENGVTLRPLAMDRLEAELRAIHAVSLEAFRHAFFYQPIPFEALHRQYQPLIERLDPALVLLAQRADEVVGFAFGIPDFCQPARGERLDTAILKTLAIRPQRSLAGLGALLIQRFHDAARERGLQCVIHAMMHEDNRRILTLSSRYARPMRRYGLFSRGLR